MLEHYSHIRIDAKRQALDALDASRRNGAPKGNGDRSSNGGNEEAPDEGGIDALVEVSDELTSQSAVERVAPHGKLLIPLERRDVMVVEGARLESEARQEHQGTRRDVNAHALNELAAWKYPSV